MELIRNFAQAHTMFGLFGLLSFLLVTGVSFKRWASGRPLSLCFGIAASLPVLFGVAASLVHLHTVRGILQYERADITNPDAGVQLAIELLSLGFGCSVTLFIVLACLSCITKKMPPKV